MEAIALWVVLTFLALSLIFYCLFGGADFGAGMLELFSSKKNRLSQRRIIDRALGPVWEANHMWLILMVVILFVGFPKVYSIVSTYLHIPLTAMLLGIIARGCAFTFRHYDAVQGRSQKPYSLFFGIASLWTPFFLGITMGALSLKKIPSQVSSFKQAYIDSWLQPFPICLGLFTLCLFSFLAAVYLIDECPKEIRPNPYFKKSKVTGLLTVLSGGLVLAAGEWGQMELGKAFLDSPFALALMGFATVLLFPLTIFLINQRRRLPRLVVGAQVLCILGAWLKIQFPVLVKFTAREPLTVFNAHAPTSSLVMLANALFFGSVLILPALYFLFHVFKSE